jgi:hypothetical protein
MPLTCFQTLKEKQNQIKFIKKKKKGLWVNCPFLPPLKPRNANPVEVTKKKRKREENTRSVGANHDDWVHQLASDRRWMTSVRAR